MKAIRCLCLFSFILCVSFSAFGQAGRGGISGTVTDPSGAAVPGAQVVLLDQATGVTRHTTANSTGFYSFISLNCRFTLMGASR
jgi:hypothetical protein